MTTPTCWRTDDPCPDCGTSLFLLDDGGPRLAIECRSCGTADTWASDDPDDRDPDHLGRGGP